MISKELLPLERGVAQLVARIVRDDEAVGSSPATPTKREQQYDNPLPV